MLHRRAIVFGLIATSTMSSAVAQHRRVLQVTALASGKLLLNGVPASLNEIGIALATLKQEGGSVWYCFVRSGKRDMNCTWLLKSRL